MIRRPLRPNRSVAMPLSFMGQLRRSPRNDDVQDPRSHRFPPHRRQGRLVAAGRLRGGRVHEDWLASLADDIARLHGEKRDILVVSSGAIALGRAVLKLPRGPLKLEDSQAAAAVGQIALARTWAEALGRHGIAAGQILLTLERHRGAAPLSQCALHHRASCSNGAACR